LRHEPPANGGQPRPQSHGLEALASQKPDVFDPRRRTSVRDGGRHLTRDRSRRPHRRGSSCDPGHRHHKRWSADKSKPRGARAVAHRANAAGLPFDVNAHRRAAREGRDDFTDDAALAEWAGLTVATFEGDPANMKLTTPEDFVREEARLGAMLGDVRTGTGYDVHAFGDGDHLMICGVRVPHTRGFLAHSDGDVGLHALVDAILGALADGDIGSHFPPSDPQWKGAASDRFLKYAVDRVTARGGRIANLEVTLICERPKIGPLRDTMRARIAGITGLNISRIAVKATTSERLGFTGREEGIAATASATIRLPWDAEGWGG
jgi:2-C-methyl-D-erythritol 4-phosphate cytidylyltransferase/2-C-methyl-D-erythritol 2,4-cyclodiphosphate synthase